MKMKKIAIALWCAFAVCLVVTVVLNLRVGAQSVEYEEVEAKVISAQIKRVVNRKTKHSTDFYKVKVSYDGEIHDLENVYNIYQYPEGGMVKAYLSNGRLFANEEGVKTSTQLATVYYVFLFGSFGLLFMAGVYSAKAKDERKKSIQCKK